MHQILKRFANRRPNKTKPQAQYLPLRVSSSKVRWKNKHGTVRVGRTQGVCGLAPNLQDRLIIVKRRNGRRSIVPSSHLSVIS